MNILSNCTFRKHIQSYLFYFKAKEKSCYVNGKMQLVTKRKYLFQYYCNKFTINTIEIEGRFLVLKPNCETLPDTQVQWSQ